jgi:hypothetical protein
MIRKIPWFFSCAVAVMAGVGTSSVSRAGETAPAGLKVVDGSTPCRVYIGWRTAERVDAAGKVTPVLEALSSRERKAGKKPKPLKIFQAPPPPEDWRKPEFDDLDWALSGPKVSFRSAYRAYRHVAGSTAEWSLVCLRARFRVKDPAGVKGLKLTLKYRGGAVVYVNGAEVKRAHLPEGELEPETPAGAYPDDAYVSPDGKRLPFEWVAVKKHPDRVAKRYRAIEVAIPAKLLRRGVNVLAIENHRAPVGLGWIKGSWGKLTYRGGWGVWTHLGIYGLALTAEAGSAVESNAGRPEKIQVWTCPITYDLMVQHRGDPNLKPAIRMSGMRNGRYSYRAVLSSSSAIRGARATASELKGDGGVIPASAVRLRYALRADRNTGFMGDWAGHDGANRFEALVGKPPAEVKPGPVAYHRRYRGPRAEPRAMLPVWVTVEVPKDARPGTYRGKVRLEARGLAGVDVPVEVKVHGWTLPEYGDYRGTNLIWQSQESSAYFYKVPLWSERHFEIMGKVLELTRPMGNRFCSTNLIIGAYHQGNKESMVRWVKKNGGYTYDFEPFDKYLDLYEKVIGKPRVLLLPVFRPGSDEARTLKRSGNKNVARVTLLDKATGKTEPMEQPLYGTAESVEFWRPLLAEVRKRLQKRGWWDVTAIGAGRDSPPQKHTVGAFRKIWPDAVWMNSAHANPGRYAYDFGGEKGFVPVRWREHVWGAGHLYDPDRVRPGRKANYPRANTTAEKGGTWAFPRVGQGLCGQLFEGSPMVLHRAISEACIQGTEAGIGRVGADYWPLKKGRYGMIVGLSGDRGMHLSVGASTRTFTVPTPDGPVASEHLEAFAEGAQLREVIIFLQGAASKAGPDVAKRVNGLLNRRARHFLRTRRLRGGTVWAAYAGGLAERDRELYELAAEVAKKVGAK